MKLLAPVGVAFMALAASSATADDITIYSWENDTHNFRVGQAADSPFITVQSTDPLGVTEGTYSGEAATAATTNFVRGAWSADLADMLEDRNVVKVDFAVKDPSPTTSQNVIFSIIIAVRDIASGGPTFTYEAAVEQRVRAQKGTAVLNYGAIDPRLTNGVLEARVEFRVSRQGGFTGSYYFDNFRVETVPEPASLALVGLGSALALLRRR